MLLYMFIPPNYKSQITSYPCNFKCLFLHYLDQYFFLWNMPTPRYVKNMTFWTALPTISKLHRIG